MNLNYHFKITSMTKRFKTLMRNGKFVEPSDTGGFEETETPFIITESATISDIKVYYRRHHSDLAKWAIDKALSDLDQCELVTIEVNVVMEQSEDENSEYEPYFGWCEVEGCKYEASNGGGCWRESGYWSVCAEHSKMHREGMTQPKMKQIAIDREKTRGIDGFLPM